MNRLTNDSIVIDTNVFMHLLNVNENGSRSAINNDEHIDDILWQLVSDTIALLVDVEKIPNEYDEKLVPMLQNEPESDRRQLLRYWIVEMEPQRVELDTRSPLYKAIKGIIHEPAEGVDRAFVYVAFVNGRKLITNDTKHILFGSTSDRPHPTKERNRRTRLKADTKRHRPKGADLMCSRDAHNKLLQDDSA